LLSVVFTVAVLVNVILNAVPLPDEQIAIWVGTATLLPLGLLLFTGVYLFILPYRTRWQGPAARTDDEN
jgi:hypothetical protein